MDARMGGDLGFDVPHTLQLVQECQLLTVEVDDRFDGVDVGQVRLDPDQILENTEL